VESLKWDCLGVVEYQGSASEADKNKIIETAKALAKSVKDWK
jgi:hypothetical protein